MKRFTFAALFAAALSFTACGGGETKDASKDSTGAKTEQPSDKPAETAGNDIDKALDTYEANITKYAEVAKKVQAGDAAAATEMQNLAKELSDAGTTLGTKAAEMTPAQQQRMVEIGKKMQEAMTPPTK